ncbi:chymotrypsin-2-like [Bacillus rossius redtenbacheri]|uniref:chymotrypsin-2-like n=1 Tax=Bacillus rossius redtenbacheri TaxID=93214 RepID=UPI002FDDD63C
MRVAVSFLIFVTYATQARSARAREFTHVRGSSHTCEGVHTRAREFTHVRAEVPASHELAGAAQPSRLQPGRLANSEPAHLGQFPYQALIVGDHTSVCGGSLISEAWVLTSGLCAYHQSSFQVSLGLTNMSDSERGKKTFVSREAILHEDFNIYTFVNDIALIHVTAHVIFSPLLSPVGLPAFADASQSYDDREVDVSGWGEMCDGGNYVDNLHFISTYVISNARCAGVYPDYAVPASKLCTWDSRNEGLLHFDSGDPVVLRGQRGPVQVGVGSFSARSVCRAALPSAHTRVTAYLGWLNNHTRLIVA